MLHVRTHSFPTRRSSDLGVGDDLDARTWRGVFRQLVAAGLLDVDAEGYGGLRLTDASRAVLRGEHTIMLRKELRSEEHTSELQSLMRISYAVFCLKKKKKTKKKQKQQNERTCVLN